MERTWRTTVRWSECDPAGILYHGRIFDWFSEARVNWLKAAGLDYYAHLRPRGVELLLLEVRASFLAMMRPGDDLTVRTDLDEVTPVRLGFVYKVLRDDVMVAEGATSHAFVIEGRARRFDRVHPESYRRFADLAGLKQA